MRVRLNRKLTTEKGNSSRVQGAGKKKYPRIFQHEKIRPGKTSNNPSPPEDFTRGKGTSGFQVCFPRAVHLMDNPRKRFSWFTVVFLLQPRPVPTPSLAIHTRVRRSSRRRRASTALLARRRSDSALSDANRCAAAIYETVRVNAIGLK